MSIKWNEAHSMTRIFEFNNWMVFKKYSITFKKRQFCETFECERRFIPVFKEEESRGSVD